MQNFIAQSMRRAGLAPKNKVTPTSITGNAARKVPESNAPLAHMEVDGKYAYSTLSYPLDLQSRVDLGHYMMFYVNIPNESKYGAQSDAQRLAISKKEREGTALTESEKQQKAILKNEQGYSKGTGKTTSYDQTGKSWKAGETDKVLHRETKNERFPNLTKRTNDAITLYMPNTGITASHKPKWESGELGGDIGEATGRVQSMMQNGLVSGISGFMEQAATKMERMGGAMVGALAGGDLNAVRDKLSNRAENKFLETFFKGIDLRTFQFSWQFRPKSPEEMVEVNKIIKTFKFHSSPEFPNDHSHGRFFTVPATFDIFYMYRGDENQWINKIGQCVCGSVNINYSPTAWQTFRPLDGDDMPQGAPPTEIDMTLDFMETQIITKQDVIDGF